MLLSVLLATVSVIAVATPEREATVIDACGAWQAGLASDAPPQTHRVEPDGLCFYGSITTESSADFVNALATVDASKPLVVVLTSGGGEVNAGMAMGEALLPLTTTVVAQRSCFSSCANYPFLAGDRRVIGQDTILGYHGGIPDTPEQYWTDLRAEYSKRMSGESLELSMAASRKASDDQVDRQDAFLRSVDVDVDLFRWMATLSALPADELLAVCPVPDVSMFVFSNAALAARNVVIHENNGPTSDAALSAELAKRNRSGLACYLD